MTILHFLIPILAALVGIAQAAAERVVDFFSWNHSIFSKKYPFNVTVDDLRKESPKFTHPREVSWARKHMGYPWLQKLKSTILVGITDLWHFGDWVTSLSTFIFLPLLILVSPELNIIQYIGLFAGSYIVYALTFHLFYHKFLYLDNEKLLAKDKIITQ